jgi:hypothetical protein
MRFRTVLGASVFAMSLSVAHAELREIDDAQAPDKATPMAEWTPVQQWSRPGSGRGPSTWGYNGKLGMLVFADEMGDKLSELGRVTMIRSCFEYGEPEAKSALQWAICGPDVKAFNMKKLEGEVQAAGLSESGKKSVIDDVNTAITKAKKIGEAVEAAAKDDPGVAQVLKLADDAKAEWGKYIGANKAAFER